VPRSSAHIGGRAVYKTSMASSRPLALVTGASSGIGAAFADRLARDGYDLVVVARRKERLEALSAQVHKAHGSKAEVLVADLASAPGVASLEARLSRGDVALLVNNAGVSGYKPFAQLATSTLDELVAIHISAVSHAVRAALPGMIAAKRGGIINIASLLGLSGTLPPNPLPFRATYGAAKAYLIAFTQMLAGELKETGVKVQVCLPGVVTTEFHDFLPPEARQRLQTMAMKAEDVVRASMSALARSEVVCVPGLDDAAALEAIGEAQRAVMSAANRPQLAARYRA
jgi:short-subunit dehydrogenase